ncbi:MAG: methionyl-tRNA formyltransferase [Thiomonas sp.]
MAAVTSERPPRRLRVAFAGTPEFAAQALRAILAAGYAVPLVFTQPDRPAGRGLKRQPSPVKQLALAAHCAVLQPLGLRLHGRHAADAAAAHAALRDCAADVLVVAAYGLILPQSLLDLPRLGCINIHASLLPRWRGAAPIQRAIEAGDAQTGITLMQMDAGLDTGPMLLRAPLPIASDDTAATLHDKLAACGAQTIVHGLDLLERGALTPQPQPDQGASYADKIGKHEAALDWARPADVLARRVRAFTPWPGAQFTLPDGRVFKVGAAQALPASAVHAAAAAGTVLRVAADGLDVRCADGVLRITRLQKPGGTMQGVAQWVPQAQPWVGLVLPLPPAV